MNTTISTTPKTRPPTPPAWLGWLLPAGFSLLAVWFFLGARPVPIPIPGAAQVAESSLVVGPRRQAMTDPPAVLIEGREQSCNGCHQIFTSASPAGAGAALDFHHDVRLAHGLNDRCINCHDPENRQMLTLRDGSAVPFSETPKLCSQCHGTVYRDWERGTHGKTLGSWVTGSPEQNRLGCNQCHDPHSPRFEPMRPLPGPNTLRMGDPHGSGPAGEPHRLSPLQHWLRGRAPGAAESGHTGEGHR